MKLDIATMSAQLASDTKLTGYDFWRAIKMIDDELCEIERRHAAIPIQLIYARQVLKKACSARNPEL